MSELEVAGVVTLKDVWQAQTAQTAQLADAINAVERALERLAGHLDAIDQRNAGADRTLLDYEGRLRALERWRYALPTSVILGVGSAVTAIVAVIHR